MEMRKSEIKRRGAFEQIRATVGLVGVATATVRPRASAAGPYTNTRRGTGILPVMFMARMAMPRLGLRLRRSALATRIPYPVPRIPYFTARECESTRRLCADAILLPLSRSFHACWSG